MKHPGTVAALFTRSAWHALRKRLFILCYATLAWLPPSA